MCSKYSDTIAREQQIHELTHHTKLVSPTSIGRTQSHELRACQIIVIAVIHIIFALFVFGHFTINNGALIREIYYSLIDISNETVTETPSFFKTIR